MPYKVIKVLVTIIYFPFSYNYTLKKDIPDFPSRINTQRAIPKRKVDPTPDYIIKIPDLISSKEHNSLIIF